ncbi:hypothetical protein ACHAC9_03995 [Massilia sp. CMS3.1]|uniref:hypothetical protein n=1 Tax=Massilia sp. CMS3.1 TaxID=3373083 RepID=UPI003EE64F65
MNTESGTVIEDGQRSSQESRAGIGQLADADATHLLGAHGPLFFRLGWVYLLAPTVIVLITFQRIEIGIAIALAAVASSVGALRWSGAVARVPGASLLSTWPYMIASGTILWLSGMLPPFGENSDWLKHFALFNELIEQSWPPVVPGNSGFATLRYSLSWYVVPALIAKSFGTEWLSLAIFLWSTLGLYIALVFGFGTRAWSVAQRFTICIVFLLFSGADIIGTHLVGVTQSTPLHFEWWAGFGQLSSTVTGLFWTPQHAIPAALATFMVLRFPERSLRAGGVLTAAIAVWSPFTAVGLVPLFLWAGVRSGYRHIFSWINLLTAPVLLLSAAYFLTRGAAGSIPFGFIWSVSHVDVLLWFEFVMVEFIAIALALLVLRERSTQLIAVAAGFLLVLSLCSGGAYNDLLMRSSLPALALLALLAAVAVVSAPNDLRKAPLVIFLVVGLVTPLGEIMRGFMAPRLEATRKARLQDIIGGKASNLEAQYLAPLAQDEMNIVVVAHLAEMGLEPFGIAEVDPVRRHIVADTYTDGGLMSKEFRLPAGLYEIDATLSWDVTAPVADKNGGHLSLYGMRLLVPILGKGMNKKVSAFVRLDGKPFRIALGLGGWSSGKGFIEVHNLELRAVSVTKAH